MTLAERLPRPSVARERLAARARRRLGIKRYLPRTLFGRSLMIIVTPVLLAQAIAVTYFYQQHFEHMTSRLSFAVAGEIAMLIEEMRLVDEPEAQRDLFDRAARTMQLTVTFEPGASLRPRPATPGHWILESELEFALEGRVGRPFTVVPEILDRWAEVQVQLEEGVLVVLIPRQRLFSQSSQNFIVWMIGSAAGLFAIALVFMRNQIRPIRRLAVAAESFGKGRDVPHFRLEGASEVRQAARAFLVMRDRIQRMIAQRTEMLAGVSHDLRTPLTRMKLQLAMMDDDPDIRELCADVADMERMIEGYLAFARGNGAEEPVPTDLGALLHEVAAGARRSGGRVELSAGDGLVLPVRRHAMKRCLANLFGNAVRYAEHAWVQAAWAGPAAEVIVDDDGPGIPDEHLEDVFKPFFRLDSSRNVATGGTGLGLTIARDVARNHGGDILLSRSPKGGLRCILRLPG